MKMSFLSKNLNLTSKFWPSDILDIIKKYLLCPKIIASSGKSINIWSSGVITKKIIGHSNTVTVISLSPNKKYIASGDVDGNVKIWDSITGNCENSMKFQTKIDGLGWCPKSTYIASSCSSENRVFIWHSLEAIIFQSILSYKHNPTKVYEGEKMVTFSFNKPSPWSKNGTHFVATNYDMSISYNIFRIYIWNNESGICEKTIECDEPMKYVAWSSDGRHIVSSGDTSIQMWNALTFELEYKMPNKYCNSFYVE